jgi:hypothetical protein
MDFTIKKYGVLVSFYRKIVFFGKIEGYPPLDFEPIFLKAHKNLYTRPLCITDTEYGLYDQKSYGVLVSFYCKLVVFGKLRAKLFGF